MEKAVNTHRNLCVCRPCYTPFWPNQRYAYIDNINNGEERANTSIVKILWYHHPNVFLQSEHNSPHIHAIHNEDVAAIDFMKIPPLE